MNSVSFAPILLIAFVLIVILIAIVSNHFYVVRVRNTVLDSIEQSIEIGYCDLDIIIQEPDSKNRPVTRYGQAEVVFTEKGLFIFRYSSFLGLIKLFTKYEWLYVHRSEPIPFINKRMASWRVALPIELLHIEGRRVTIDFAKPGYQPYRLVIPDLRSNDGYRNLLRLQRYRYDVLQREKRVGNGR